MYPEQPSQPQQPEPLAPAPTPVADMSYLDSIAAPTQTKIIKPWQLWSMIGGVLVVLIVGVMLILSSGGQTPADRYASYLYRLEALQGITGKSDKSIQSSKLRAINASTNSILTTADQAGIGLLGAVELKKLPTIPKKSTITPEFATLSTKLEDARLNAVYDRTYAREIGYQLAKLRAEMTTIYNATKSKSLRAYLETTDKNIKPLVTQLNQYSNSQS